MMYTNQLRKTTPSSQHRHSSGGLALRERASSTTPPVSSFSASLTSPPRTVETTTKQPLRIFTSSSSAKKTRTTPNKLGLRPVSVQHCGVKMSMDSPRTPSGASSRSKERLSTSSIFGERNSHSSTGVGGKTPLSPNRSWSKNNNSSSSSSSKYIDPSSAEDDAAANGLTRVWVSRAAVEAARKKNGAGSRFGKSASFKDHSSRSNSGAGDVSASWNSSHTATTASFGSSNASGSFSTTASLRASTSSSKASMTANWPPTNSSSSIITNATPRWSNLSTATATTAASIASDSESTSSSAAATYQLGGGSGSSHHQNNNNSLSSSIRDASPSLDVTGDQGRRNTWPWMAATILEQSKAAIVVLLEEEDDDLTFDVDIEEETELVAVDDDTAYVLGSSTAMRHRASRNSGRSTTSSSATRRQVKLPASALADGTLLLCNEVDDQGRVRTPDDLITLTHLHEPAVLEALRARYAQEHIYTNTGAVLLALNPFQSVRGLYGEAVMKRYWERAESQSRGGASSGKAASLPPHVYAIADAAFRNMMRQLEDYQQHGDASRASSPSSTTSGSSGTGPWYCHQSILVSGESGAGKTVTTKFVMKYLAALSQRSVKRSKEHTTRAYVKAREQKHQPPTMESPRRGNNSKSFSQPSWATASRSSATSSSPSRWGSASSSYRGSTNIAAGMDDLATLTTSLSLASSSVSSSIEGQVLQSNPILESFGNARTVRNDNSSRFGKFIEIQFTTTGQLVGASIDTYLLEKVRLVHQGSGERNYHIFYEMLSGGMEARELSQYFIARTAAPEDFRLTASGTYDRRDGVSDRETYRALRTACNAMKFGPAVMHQIFSVTAALLHASNLTLVEASSSEECHLDTSNVHLAPVCHLLCVTPQDLNQALCVQTIQAGNDHAVERSLSLEKAEKGLEALLKATYGALFTHLVRCINQSINYKRKKDRQNEEEGEDDALGKRVASRPAASVGVLDIFGFESFTKNSFEQLCINFCNEALQQQFNAFVLKNEQAEYEREGIEWSFIEFPENQDVLDLIEKRGAGILSVLDDQCRAPGPSDKAFCLDVYKVCKGHARFSASRSQHANLQFSVLHYAGPVEYTTDGFTEKNRDELSKESTELLKGSSSQFVRELASIIESSHEMPADVATASNFKQMHRADSSVGRATVGGQFRRQLRNLRLKIDQTSPHYIRCLKPNDDLVPDRFDTAVVAEQLRCGGILETVRVARAGFSQHYPHADFLRRYRTLAWRELGKKLGSSVTSTVGNISSSKAPHTYLPRTGVSSTPRSSGTGKTFRIGYLPSIQTGNGGTPDSTQSELSPAAAKAQCKDLIRILFRKIQLQQQKDSESGDPAASTTQSATENTSSEPSFTKGGAGLRSSSFSKPVQSFLPPTASSSKPTNGNGPVKSRYSPWDKPAETPKQEVSTPSSTWKRGGLNSSDYAKLGIQLGKTKVFLRHKAFETLERIRSREQTNAATTLNAIFRMYLARMAYIPYRDAFRMELIERRQFYERDDYKESKEDFDETGSAYEFQKSMRMQCGGRASVSGIAAGSFEMNAYAASMVDKWMESQIRNAIHNPVPRHEWGKAAPSTETRFKWVLSEGLWVRNYLDDAQ